jgi:hypothetical protein
LTALLAKMETLGPEERARMAACSGEIVRNFSPARFGRSVASIADFVDSGATLEPVTGGTQ